MPERNERYRREVVWSDEDEGYIARAPELPGCSAFGATREVALAELDDAIAAWIEAAVAVGNEVPDPISTSPFAHRSGRINLRMPKELHEDLARSAEIQGCSLNQFIVYLLAKECSAHNTRRKICEEFPAGFGRASTARAPRTVILTYATEKTGASQFFEARTNQGANKVFPGVFANA